MESVEGYRFEKDPIMQELGNSLFPEGCYITASKGTRGKKILSFRVGTEHVKRISTHMGWFWKGYLTVMPEFDILMKWYNLVITLELRTREDMVAFDYIISGKEPDRQNEIIEHLLSKHYAEAWTSSSHTFYAVIAPLEETIINEQLIRKIHKWNNMDMKECNVCGKKISQYSERDVCIDCTSKLLVEANRKEEEK